MTFFCWTNSIGNGPNGTEIPSIETDCNLNQFIKSLNTNDDNDA